MTAIAPIHMHTSPSTSTGSTAADGAGKRSPFWTRIGQSLAHVRGGLSDALRAAGLDWSVRLTKADKLTVTEKVNVGTEQETTRSVPTSIPNKWLLMRGDNDVTLGVVGSRYRPYDNHTVFTPCDHLQSQGARYVAGGPLNYGRACYVLMQPEGGDVTVTTPTGTDRIRVDIMLSTSHDGSERMQYEIRATRVHDAASATLSIRDVPGLNPSMSASHTVNSAEALKQAERMLSRHARYVASFANVVQRLADTRMSATQFRKVCEEVCPVPSSVAKALETLSEDELPKVRKASLERWRDRINLLVERFVNDQVAPYSAYGAYTVLSEWYEWGKPSKGRTREDAAAHRAFQDAGRSFRNKIVSRLLTLT